MPNVKSREDQVMGKIVKFCSSCDESFDNKFSFCPNCAEALDTFEMNPVNGNKTEEVSKTQEVAATENFEIQKPAFLTTEGKEMKANTIAASSADDDILELDVEGNGSAGKIEIPPEVETSFQDDSFETAEVDTVVSKIPQITEKYADTPNHAYDYKTFTASGNESKKANDNFHITVIQEKNVKERNALLLGATALMLALTFGGFIYSLFAKDLDLAAIDGNSYNTLVPMVDDPTITADDKERPKDEDKGGGGGGGGGNDVRQASKGRYASQSSFDPIIAPDTNLIQRKSDTPYEATTKGKRQYERTPENLGIPNSSSLDTSNGRGDRGGIGDGRGGGQGNGEGLGLGNGEGEGAGDGKGKGDGNNTGDKGGDRDRRVSPPKDNNVAAKPGGVTTPFKLLSKPKPKYSDEARKNNIKGTVRVRVQFLANGQIGNVTPINSLGYGLTENAIAAARSIQFEPPKRNGVAQATTKVIDFNFTIY